MARFSLFLFLQKNQERIIISLCLISRLNVGTYKVSMTRTFFSFQNAQLISKLIHSVFYAINWNDTLIDITISLNHNDNLYANL